jgi:hypothetical protein
VKARARCEIRFDPRAPQQCERCKSKSLLCSLNEVNIASSYQEAFVPQSSSDETWLSDVLGDGPALPDFLADVQHDPTYQMSSGMPPGLVFSDLGLLNSSHQPKLFEPKTLSKMEALVSSTMAIGILRSIPEQMRRRETLPPFIHPYCYGSVNDNWQLPTALANAMMIAQMFHERTAENQSLLWQTVNLEQARLRAEVSKNLDIYGCIMLIFR